MRRITYEMIKKAATQMLYLDNLPDYFIPTSMLLLVQPENYDLIVRDKAMLNVDQMLFRTNSSYITSHYLYSELVKNTSLLPEEEIKMIDDFGNEFCDVVLVYEVYKSLSKTIRISLMFDYKSVENIALAGLTR